MLCDIACSFYAVSFEACLSILRLWSDFMALSPCKHGEYSDESQRTLFLDTVYDLLRGYDGYEFIYNNFFVYEGSSYL